MDTTNNRFYREPAFPSTTKTYTADDGDTMHQGANGMSLRDYFAAKAMHAALMTAEPVNGNVSIETVIKEASAIAYRVADEMLKAREA